MRQCYHTKDAWKRIALLVLVSVSQVFAQQASPREFNLNPEEPLTMDLKAPEIHRYKITLKKKNYFQTTVEQRGIDLIIALFDSQNRKLIEIDSPNGANGPESLAWVAMDDGDYWLEIRALEPSSKPGSCVIRVAPLRKAHSEDRKFIEALTLYSEGVMLQGLRTDDGRRQAISKYEQVIPFWRKLNDRPREFETVEQMAYAWRALKDERKAIENLIQVLEYARSERDAKREATILINLGRSYESLKDAAKALEFYQKAVSVDEAGGDKAQAADTLGRIAAIKSRADDKPGSIEAYTKELSLRREISDRLGEAWAMVRMGVVHGSVKESDKSLELYKKAAEIFKAEGSIRGEAQSLTNLAITHANRKEFKTAIGYAEGAIELLVKQNDRNALAQSYQLAAGIYEQTPAEKRSETEENRRKSITHYERALAIYGELKDERNEALVLQRIGTIAQIAGNATNSWLPEKASASPILDKAVDSLERAAGLFNRLKDRANEVDVLIKLGQVRVAQKDKAKALDSWGRAVDILKSGEPKPEKAKQLKEIAGLYHRVSEPSKAIECFRLELAVRGDLNDGTGSALAQMDVGRMYLALGDGQNAQAIFNQLLDQYQKAGDAKNEAIIHALLGLTHFLMKDRAKALDAFNREFQLTRKANLEFLDFFKRRIPSEIYDPELVIKRETLLALPALKSTDDIFDWLLFGRLSDEGSGFGNSALDVFRLLKDQYAIDLINIGTVLQLQFELAIANEHLKALLKQNQLLKTEIAKREGTPLTSSDKPPTDAERAQRLHSEGAFESKKNPSKALKSFQEALAIRRTLPDKKAIAATLMGMGGVCFQLNENRKALACFEEAQSIFNAEKDTKGEAESLRSIGIVHNWTGERLKAIEYYERSQAIESNFQNLNRIAESYLLLGEKQKAIENLYKAQQMSRANSHPDGDAETLFLLGLVFSSLNESEKSRDYYTKAAEESKRKIMGLFGQFGYNLRDKARFHNELGDAYYRLGEFKEAAATFQRGLFFQKDFGSKADQAYAYNKLGLISLADGNKQEALENFRLALELHRSDGNYGRQAEVMHNMATVYESLGDRRNALLFYHDALAIRYRLRDPEGAGETLDRLMILNDALNQRRLAIYYGKQAVNNFQQIRQNIQGLDKDLQKRFLSSRTGTYRKLADLLITDGRLLEAQQVLDLLKKEEYLEYVRRSGGDDLSGRATMNPREAEAERRFREIQGRIASIGKEFAELSAKEQLSSAEQSRRDRLEQEIIAANEYYNRWRDTLSTEFAAKSKGQVKTAELRNAQTLQETLRRIGDGTVALYTVVTDAKYHVVLFTPDTQVAGTYQISADDLNRKLAQFRRALQNPRFDPLPMAQEMYKIIVGPIEQNLKDYGAKTLMWSLDGTLRYLPIAALHDGNRYLIENYRVAVFTPAGNTQFDPPTSAKWRGLGLGVSKGENPLPFVTEELTGIIHDATIAGAKDGVIEGRILLDESFTKQTMKSALQQGRGYPLVHIASHFNLKPGNEQDSYLLLGGMESESDTRRRLTLAEIEGGTNLFQRVELLTLSACNTAFGSGEGAEFENFAVKAQLKGARSVVATLWPVEDQSTMLLMQTFYRLKDSNPGQPKIEALRQAQLSLLRGNATPRPLPQSLLAKRTDAAEKAPEVIEVDEGPSLPRYRKNPDAPFAHPYFWAPFIMMGNWR